MIGWRRVWRHDRRLASAFSKANTNTITLSFSRHRRSMGSQSEARMRRKNEIALEKNNKVSSSSSTLPGRDAAVYSVFHFTSKNWKATKSDETFCSCTCWWVEYQRRQRYTWQRSVTHTSLNTKTRRRVDRGWWHTQKLIKVSGLQQVIEWRVYTTVHALYINRPSSGEALKNNVKWPKIGEYQR